MIDKKQVAELRKLVEESGERFDFGGLPLPDIFNTLFAALDCVQAADILQQHPAFCTGSLSCHNLPNGVMARMEDLRKALKPFNAPGGGE